MSIASLNQFQNEVMQDSALQEQFKTAAATSPENIGELALKLGAERGYSFTLEEIQATIKATSSNSNVEEELTDEELEMVSGGRAYGSIAKVAAVTKAGAPAGAEIAGQWTRD